MSRRCCTGACHQGRTCPLRTVRIPTRRSWLSRAGAALGAAFDIPWVPVAVAIVAAIIVNS